MIKIVMFIFLVIFSTTINTKETHKQKLIKDHFFSSQCYDKKQIKKMLIKFIFPLAIESLKQKGLEEKYNSYVKGAKEKTRRYRIEKIKYNGYDKKRILCSLVFGAKPNKQQESLDFFYGEYYINIEEVFIKNAI